MSFFWRSKGEPAVPPYLNVKQKTKNFPSLYIIYFIIIYYIYHKLLDHVENFKNTNFSKNGKYMNTSLFFHIKISYLFVYKRKV